MKRLHFVSHAMLCTWRQTSLSLLSIASTSQAKLAPSLALGSHAFSSRSRPIAPFSPSFLHQTIHPLLPTELGSHKKVKKNISELTTAKFCKQQTLAKIKQTPKQQLSVRVSSVTSTVTCCYSTAPRHDNSDNFQRHILARPTVQTEYFRSKFWLIVLLVMVSQSITSHIWTLTTRDCNSRIPDDFSIPKSMDWTTLNPGILGL